MIFGTEKGVVDVKFKTVFVLFNAIVLLSFLMVFALPFFVLDGNNAGSFWKTNWYVLLALVLVLAVVNSYFIANWRLMVLLEREDWPAVGEYLEKIVIRRKKWAPRHVHLLASTYLVLSDTAALRTLETKAAREKPRALEDNALVFGIGRILAKDSSGARAFFAERIERAGRKADDWLQWYHGFSALLDHDQEAAAQMFVRLAPRSRDYLLMALSLYYLEDLLDVLSSDTASTVSSIIPLLRDRILKRFPHRGDWERELARSRSDIHVVVLSRTVADTSKRLYPNAFIQGGAR